MTHPQNTTEDRMTIELPGCTEVDHLVDPNDPASRAEWQSYMTGSKVASVIGISPWTTRLALWRQMTGREEQGYETPYATHGKDREPVIREGTERDHGCTIVTPRMLVSKANPRHAYSPDGIIPELGFTPKRLWECKTATENTALKWADGIPEFYDVQWQWGAYVTGLQFGLFTLETHEDFLPLSTQDFPIVRNDAKIEFLIDAVDDFLAYVDSDTPPPPLGAVVVTDPDEIDTIRRWNKSNAQRLDFEKEVKALRAVIDPLGENASALVTPDGEVLCHWSEAVKTTESVDWTAVEQDNPEAVEQAVVTSVDHKRLAELVPDSVAAHTSAKTTTTRRLLMGGAK